MSFLISSQRTFERDALSEAFYVLSDIYSYTVQPLKSRVPGLSILALQDKTLNPIEVIEKFREYISEKGPLIACLKIVPLETLIKTNLPTIVTYAKEGAQAKIQPTNSWKISVNKRQTNLGTMQVIEKVAEEIDWGTVNLKDPDFEIRIEIIRDLTGISVMRPDTEISMVKYSDSNN